uniref:Uncharacterized protein n=1 Tax=Arundo donax TaxID=35708 RepID=A0A0A8YMA3_ARUDO
MDSLGQHCGQCQRGKRTSYTVEGLF